MSFSRFGGFGSRSILGALGLGNTLSITAPQGYAGRNDQFPRDIKNTISFADSADDGSGLYTVTLSLGGSKALTRAGWTGSPGSSITRTSQTLATINAELVAALDLPAYTTEYQPGNNIRIVRDADSVELNKSFGVAAFAPLSPAAINNDVADGTLLDTVLPDVPGMMVSITNYTATLDEAAPTVSSSVPADNATDIAITVNPTITFSENIAFGTGNITLRENDGGWADLETFDVTTNTGGGAGTVSISGGVLTIEPTADLDNSIEYAIRIDATAITDERENAFVGIADDTTISFTTITGDVVSPSISSSVPADNATGVAVDATITITFNENVRFITSAGTFTLRDNDGGFADLEVFTPTTASAATGAGGGSASISGAVLTITPGADFVGSMEHAVRIASNVIEDLAGNDFAGIADDTTLSFTSESLGYAADRMVFEIDTSLAAGETVGMVATNTGGTWNGVVYWGDGSSDAFTNLTEANALEHTYASGGVYVIEVEATTSIYNLRIESAQAAMVTEVIQMGSLGARYINAQWQNCSNMHTFNSDPCDLSNISSASFGPRLFLGGCSSLTSVTLGTQWGTTLVSSSSGTMDEMFTGCNALTSIDLTSMANYPVTSTYFLFRNCYALATIIGFADLDWNHASGPAHLNNAFQRCDAKPTVDVRIDVSGGNWQATGMNFGFTNSFNHGLAEASYNQALEYWDTVITPPDPFVLGEMGTSAATGAGATARTSLINDHNWTITDDT